jgi:hypothetical protein
MDPHAQPTSSLTFSFPVVSFEGADSNASTVENTVTESMRRLCDEAMQLHSCYVILSPPQPIFTGTQSQGRYEFNYNITIVGSPQDVIAVKGILYSKNPSQVSRPTLSHKNKKLTRQKLIEHGNYQNFQKDSSQQEWRNEKLSQIET